MGPVGAHRRHNSLTGRPVLVSEGRTSRPWQEKVEGGPASARASLDPECYPCPGNMKRDLSPEAAAERLRTQSDTHYLNSVG